MKHPTPQMRKLNSAASQKTGNLPIQPRSTNTLNTINSMNKKKKKHRTIWPSNGAYSPTVWNSVTNVHKCIRPQVTPWIIKKTKVILQLNKLPKTKIHPSTYLEKFRTIFSQYPDYWYIFTDGSKNSNITACTTVFIEAIHKKALPMKSSIFIAEVCAIDLALNIILFSLYL